MKHLLTIAFVSTCLFSFGQFEQSNMFWNNYSNLNPAMSGFQYQQHAALTYQNNYPASPGRRTALKVNYNQRIFGQHGVGINFNGDYYSLLNNRITANYNYQFDLNTAGRLSAGVGIGAGRSQYSKKEFGDLSPYYNPSPYNYFNLSFGIAYSWKNLILGVSTQNLFPESDPALSSYAGYPGGINAHAAYNILLNRNFQLTPRALYSSDNGFNQLGFNMTTTFKRKYSFGASLYNRNSYAVNLGLTIKNKFQLAYSFGKTISSLSNSISGGRHEVTLAFTLAHQPQICGLPLAPNF